MITNYVHICNMETGNELIIPLSRIDSIEILRRKNVLEIETDSYLHTIELTGITDQEVEELKASYIAYIGRHKND